jgi:hypothetical protein
VSTSGAAAGLLLVVAGLWLLLQTIVGGLAGRLVNLGGSSSSSSAASTAKNAAGTAAAGVGAAVKSVGGVLGSIAKAVTGGNATAGEGQTPTDAASGANSASPVGPNGQPTPYGQAQGVQTQ